jgi:hypothetical protein
MERLVAELELAGIVPRDASANEALAWALTHRAGAYRLGGRFRDAQRDYRKATTIFLRCSSAPGLVHCTTWLAENYRCRGQFDIAARMALRANELAEDFEAPDVRAWPLWNLGEIRKLQGRFGEAISLFKQARQLFSGGGNMSGVAWCLSSLADALRVSDPGKARELNLHAMSLASGDYILSACWLSEGEYHRLRGELNEAMGAFKLGGDIPSERQVSGSRGRIGLQARLAILETARVCGKADLAGYRRIEQWSDAMGFEWLRVRTLLAMLMATWQKTGDVRRGPENELKRLLARGRYPYESQLLGEAMESGPTHPLPLVFN